jgi:type IV pilus assembly protein PilE
MGARRGFTLTEIIVTMAIMAVIAAFAIPSFVRQRERASARQAADYLRVIATGEKMYYAKWKTFIPAAGSAAIRSALGAETVMRTNDYTFSVTAPTATTFTATATRNGGPGGTITLNQNDAWGTTGAQSAYQPQAEV